MTELKAAHPITQDHLLQKEPAATQSNEQMEDRIKERTAQLEAQANRLRVLADHIATHEQRERKRIAAMLHDHLQQILVASTFQLAEATRSIKNQEFDKVANHLDRGKAFLSDAIRSARALSTELRPPILYEDGLTQAFEWLALKFKREHELEVILDMEDPQVTLSDSLKIMIFESVKELLFNVVKHAQVKQARLTFKILFNHVLYICVQDEGVGLQGSQKAPGMTGSEGGFGLFSMQERLKIQNAEFEVISPANKGLKIEIRIPINPLSTTNEMILEQERIVLQKKILPSKTDDKIIKILLVDDHQIVRKSIADLLKSIPMLQIVAQANNGLDAIEKTVRFLPDVIIMDINMPKLNGIETTRLIKKNFPDIKIIGLSVQDENDIADSMKKAGALTLLNISGDPEDLIATILNCMENPSTPPNSNH
jgi:CheY-like chemotaxis protein